MCKKFILCLNIEHSLMLRKIRIVVAVAVLMCVTALFIDFTGFAVRWFGWLASLQFVPAVMALNVIALAVLLLITVVMGRVYCSVICPLGIMQDCINWMRSHVGPRRSRRNRFGYTKALTVARIGVLALFALLIITGVTYLAGLLDPYSGYGRIASALIAPVYDGVNNVLAAEAEGRGSYAFYRVDSAPVMWPVMTVALLTLAVVGLMSWFGGRRYCNTICPVGTILGCLSRISLLRPVIDTSKCNGCRSCERNCKASCIDASSHSVDYSRCVACMDCIDNCRQGAISFTFRNFKRGVAEATSHPVDTTRRTFLTAGAVIAGAAAANAAGGKLHDGGLAPVVPKTVPVRKGRIAPPGAVSVANLQRRCTACQACIANCPNGVLRPSMDLASLLQPEVGYEHGYCRPECTRCSEVCPAGAILKIDEAEKSAIHIGYAHVDYERCLSVSEGVNCGKCSRKCPAGAIEMVAVDPSDADGSRLMPVVNESRCIGCGACENLCPVSPVSAIVVSGYEIHRID